MFLSHIVLLMFLTENMTSQIGDAIVKVNGHQEGTEFATVTEEKP